MEMEPINAGAEATRARAVARADAAAPAIAAALAEGRRGLAEIAQYLNERGILTARGGTWRTETVRRAMKRLSGCGHTEFAVRSRSRAQSDRAQRRYARETAARARNRAMYLTWKAAQQNAAAADQRQTTGVHDKLA